MGEKFPRLQSPQHAGKLLRNLVDYGGSFEVATCVQLQLHFAQRPSELRCAKWADFDLNKAIWTLPLAQSKSRKYMTKPHTIMLSTQALAALKELQAYTYISGNGRRHRYLNHYARMTGLKVFRVKLPRAKVLHGRPHLPSFHSMILSW